jgi:hypothetical protein
MQTDDAKDGDVSRKGYVSAHPVAAQLRVAWRRPRKGGRISSSATLEEKRSFLVEETMKCLAAGDKVHDYCCARADGAKLGPDGRVRWVAVVDGAVAYEGGSAGH